jgi:hypothetical protein
MVRVADLAADDRQLEDGHRKRRELDVLIDAYVVGPAELAQRKAPRIRGTRQERMALSFVRGTR